MINGFGVYRWRQVASVARVGGKEGRVRVYVVYCFQADKVSTFLPLTIHLLDLTSEQQRFMCARCSAAVFENCLDTHERISLFCIIVNNRYHQDFNLLSNFIFTRGSIGREVDLPRKKQ